MRLYLFICFLLLLVTKSKAQYEGKSFDLENYHYTLNYPDHTVTFYAKPIGEVLKFTDPTKKYYWFSSNQLKITQGGFSGKLLHGRYSDFYLNKNLKEQGEFSMGLKKGKWNTWTEDGLLSSTVNYKNGTLEGQFYQYDYTGNLAEEGRYRHGKINGTLKKYTSIDSVTIITYKDGVVQPAAKRLGLFRKFFKAKAKSN